LYLVTDEADTYNRTIVVMLCPFAQALPGGKPLGRPRVKFVRVEEMLDAARGATVSG
jgi:hypothetical protein